METARHFDLVVVGAGPGGYVAAIRAAQLGFKVACIEKSSTLGGTCLNVGCIPSKALLESSEHFASARQLKVHGVMVGDVTLDLKAMMARKERIVKTLTSGIGMLFKKNGITALEGTGTFVSPRELTVSHRDGSREQVTGERILIATGSTVTVPRGLGLDGERIISSTEALELKEVPGHLGIIGAGVIGLELGSVWSRLGAKVTVLELLPRILAGFDTELATLGQKVLSKQGLKFVLGAKVTEAKVEGTAVRVAYTDAEGKGQELSVDRLLVAVGRRPYTDGLGLEAVGLTTDRAGRLEVNDHFETAVKGIFAIGDVIRGPMLAHKAEEEGIAAVERMAGKAGHVNYSAIPGIVYTHPEIATVGATEDELKEKGIDFKKGSFPFQANGRAKAIGETDGMVKVLADARTDRILGAHILGPRAGDLIAELAVAMEFGSSAEDIARSCHAHPTLSEVVKEACLAVDGRAIHF